MIKKNEYRGKRIDTGEWVYGSLVYMKEHIVKKFKDEKIVKSICNIYSPNGLNKMTGLQQGQNGEPFKSKQDFVVYEVSPNSVGQWIGEKDLDGVKIYENSILIDKDGNEGVVIYTQAAFWCRELVSKPVGSHGPQFDNWDELKIIGNATDDPKLMIECNGRRY